MANVDRVKQIEDLEQDVRDAKTQSLAQAARSKLGHHKVGLGFAAAGLRDILVACKALGEKEAFEGAAFAQTLESVIKPATAPKLSNDPSQLAHLGEALRVYARDVQLSRTLDGQLEGTIKASISCFDKALLGAAANDQKAWLLAHRAAARMMLYWLGLASSATAPGDDAIFGECEKDFKQALDVRPSYTWGVQFLAFLYALRGKEGTQGEQGDFDKALALLAGLGKDVLSQPTIQRSMAMLLSYNAASPPGVRDEERCKDAARASIVAARNAQKDDQDEFLASYSGAVSSWALFDISLGANRDEFGGGAVDKLSDEQPRLLRNAQAAVETAETRARNAVSQALIALVGLTFIRGKLAEATGDEHEFETAGNESQVLQDLIRYSGYRDIESRAMVIRDPVWKAIQRSPICTKRFAHPGFDALRVFARDADTVTKMKTRHAAL